MQVSDLTQEQISSLTPEQIEAIEKDESQLDAIMAGKAAPEDKPEQEDAAGAANGAGKDEEEEPVVLNKSGKGVIPYSTVKDLRVENATLKEQLQQLQQAQTELESLKQQRAEAKTPGKRREIQDKLNSHIEVMREDFPEIGSSLESVNEIISDMSEELEAMRAEAKAKADADKTAREKSVAEQVAEAKENNPDLVHWEHNDPDAWDEAIKQDELLRTNAKWADKPYDERFTEVVRRVRAILPQAQKPNTPKNAQETRAAAKAKLEQAPVRQPTTLSDIHGGANPGNERDQLDNLSPAELTARLMKMPDSRAAAMRADLD